MRHHFGDLLDRSGDYWTIVPNRERYAYRIGDVPAGSKEVTIVTIGKEDHNWSRVLTLPSLVELTLHEPTTEQLTAIGALRSVKRLRITHARPQTLEFIESLSGVEELVLEYISGVSDLSPLRRLTGLRALHLENLRRVANFGGLAGLASLRYLAITGTLDWKQPIENFDFLRGLPSLESLFFWQVITHQPYPALAPALSLKKLKQLKLHGSYLNVEEYAMLEAGLKGVEGAAWGPFRVVASRSIPVPSSDIRAHLPVETIRENYPEVLVTYDGRREIGDPDSRWVEFTGKGEGRLKYGSKKAEVRSRESAELYAALMQAAQEIIDREKRV